MTKQCKQRRTTYVVGVDNGDPLNSSTDLLQANPAYTHFMAWRTGGGREAGNTHINGFVTEILDVLRAHVEGGLAGHQKH